MALGTAKLKKDFFDSIGQTRLFEVAAARPLWPLQADINGSPGDVADVRL